MRSSLKFLIKMTQLLDVSTVTELFPETGDVLDTNRYDKNQAGHSSISSSSFRVITHTTDVTHRTDSDHKFKSPTEKRGLFNQLYTAGDSGVGVRVREGRGLWQVLLFGGAPTALIGAKIEFVDLP